jgi:hypothetical protein
MGSPLPAVAPPKIVAIATDPNVIPTNASVDPDLPGPPPKYGQDFTFGVGRAAPNGEDVGTTEAELKPKMEKLLGIFASGDKTGMARRLFNKFLAKQSRVYYFEDADLNAAADAHDNITVFRFRALGAPIFGYSAMPAPGKTRIHQALKAANWDVAKLVAPTDLGVPAFNKGDKYTYWGLGGSTGDFDNGLGLMINGVQHVYVIATNYLYDKTTKWYHITLRFIFYDVFGLDDKDVDKYGAKDDNWHTSNAKIGITAWWQLQHQHAYAPLVTRITLEKTYDVPAV